MAAVVLAAATAAASMQVHVALGKTQDSLSVAWVSTNAKGTSEVHWGVRGNALTSKATGDVREFTCDTGRVWQTRTALMTNLTVGERYYYKVGDSVNGYSDIFSVVNRKRGPPYNHVLFGDMGAKAAFTLCDACTQFDAVCNAKTCAKNTTVGLVSEVEKADMMLHVGDFAYDLRNDNGKLGDQFMENIEQIAARVPYMVSHGNHEDDEQSLAHYIERFRSQPVNSEPATYTTNNGEAPNTMYFSWNFGMVHYIAFSTELFHAPVSGYSSTVTSKSFLEWIEKDLKEANLPHNREQYPWILVHGHRPLYSSSIPGHDATVRRELEPLFFKYGVSFSVNGHQHNYERSWPTYQDKSEQSNVDPNATIYIVTGAAGSQEMHTPFWARMPSWSAFRSNTFGYTRMIVHNATHINFQQVQTDPSKFPLSKYGDVIDDVWIVQRRHGPFDEARAPKTTPTSCPPTLCTSHDHFDPILRPMLGAQGSTLPLHEVISNYRREHGEVAWARKLRELLGMFNSRPDGLQAGVEWEDGLLDKHEEDAFKWLDSHGKQ